LSKKVLVVYRELAEVGAYARAISAVDLTPVLVEAGRPVSLDDYSGLLLTGGSDVNPSRYGAVIRPETDPPDDERDEMEAALIEDCIERDFPLLAICRGLQIMNVHLGGTLTQHLDDTLGHQARTPDHSLPAHSINIEPGTLLAAIAGQPQWSVNSRHHQAALGIGDGLRVSARHPGDGTIEAIEKADRRFMLAVQWHPEDQALLDLEQRKLFRSFAAAL
jgi:gamma-glutamyl-gamma-aminobutyrate hydrolase PuuD